MSRSSTDVIIIGAGPSGLLLSQLLYQNNISNIILERSSKDHVLSRIRAGVLERGTIDALGEAECSERLLQQKIDHDGLIIGNHGDLFEIPIKEITGHCVAIYGQTEITKDLIAACEQRNQPILWQRAVKTIDHIKSDAPEVTLEDGKTLSGALIVGCDGYHGIARQMIPKKLRKEVSREYAFGWLGVLIDKPPLAHNVIYAKHEDGFALSSMRSMTRSRYYVQTGPGEKLDDWPMARFWAEFKKRIGTKADNVEIGDPIEKSIAPLRSFVCQKLQYGALFLAGDAAHIVPPTGAKGLNLAIADIRRLARAIILWKKGFNDGLERYENAALQRIWKVERFSWYMTNLLHSFCAQSEFETQMQRAEMNYIKSSQAAQTSIAENYVGLDFDD